MSSDLCCRFISIPSKYRSPLLKVYWPKREMHPGQHDVVPMVWFGATILGQTYGYMIGSSPEIFRD